MTDAATLLPLPPPDPGARIAGAGLRPLEGPARGPGQGGATPADAGPGDPFAAVLQGFLGAALTPPAAPAPPPAAAPALASGDAATPAPTQTMPLPDGRLPTAEAAPGGKPLPAAAGSPLPGTGPGAGPAAALTAGLAAAPPDAPAAATGGASADDYAPPAPPAGSNPATGRGDAGGTNTAPPPSEAATLLADLDRSRGALAPAARPVAAGAPGRARGAELPDTALPATTSATPDGGPAAALADFTTTAGATLAPSSTGTGATGTATAAAGTGAASRGDGPASGPGSGGSLAPLGDSSSFASGLGERLLDLGRDGTQSARLRLHPESLGPLDVRIQVEDGEARVWFNAAHGQTRDAIEASLPRLRELFASQGIELGRVQVDVRSDGGAPPAWQPPAGDTGAGGGGRTPRDGRDEPVLRPADPWGDRERADAAGRPGSRRLDVLA